MPKKAKIKTGVNDCDSVNSTSTVVCIESAASKRPKPKSSKRPASGAWKRLLIVNEKGVPKPLLANCIIALRRSPEWRGVLAWDEFARCVVARKAAPWEKTPSSEWTNQHDRLAVDWLQHQGILAGLNVVGQSVQTVAQETPFHNLRDWLNNEVWDGTLRLETWLIKYLGVSDSAYARAVGARWLISAVARIMKPGAKVDHCLILEGPQGIGKSKVFAVLGGDYYTDEIAELGSKDASLQTMGIWVVELAELDSMSRSDLSRVKAFLTRSTNRFRPPYGARLIKSPRQCIFGGTVNFYDYLKDSSGDRRFWPVLCQKIDIDGLAKVRDQLWAEAVHAYRAGQVWWLDTPELIAAAAAEQSDRYHGDAWQNKIADYTENKQDVSVDDILTYCLQKPAAQWQQTDKNRIATCLQSLKWTRYRAAADARGHRAWRYQRPK